MRSGSSWPCSGRSAAAAPTNFSSFTARIWEYGRPPTSIFSCRSAEPMVTLGLIGILFGLALLIWLSYRGWSVLLLAPIAAMITALFSGEPLLAHLTQTFMVSAAG